MKEDFEIFNNVINSFDNMNLYALKTGKLTKYLYILYLFDMTN